MTTTQTDLTVEQLRALARSSVELIDRMQAPSGAYPACPTFPVYRYSWFRDGAFIADAMSRAGERESSERFFSWCDRVVSARAGRIEALLADRAAGRPIAAERFLPCRFTVDGEDDGAEWWNFQLDGYGSWLWAVAGHAARTGGGVDAYANGIRLTVDYLGTFWSEPCYDWWEEHAEHRHTSTLAAIAGGLAAIADARGLAPEVAARARETAAAARTACLGQRTGAILTKWAGSGTVDASLVACATPFRLLRPDDPTIRATVAQIEERLVHGGVNRYEADTYYGGGEWLLLAGLLGWHYAESGRIDDAWSRLRWIAAQARPGGELPEQVSRSLLAPEREQEWVDRWGPSACPLLWSHAMYLTLAVELGVLDGTGA